jgi:TRAP-type C4-dicarboxylate transport system substrate-binding protein
MKALKVLFAFGVLVVLSAVFGSPTTAQEPVKLTFASALFGPTHGISKLNEEFCAEIEKRTNGKVKVTYHPAGTFIAAPQLYDAVEKGILDIGQSAAGYNRGKFPLTEVFDYPLGFGTDGTALQITEIQNAYYQKFRPKEFDNVKVLLLFGGQGMILHTKKPVRKLEDLKGMRIRAAGTASQIPVLLGATAVSVPAPEVYEVLRKGAADGVLIFPEALKGYRLAEVVKYTTKNYSSSAGACFYIVMNKEKFQSLSPDVQKAIDDVRNEFIPKYGQRWDDDDQEGLEYAKSLGNEIIDLSPEENNRWMALTAPLVGEYVKAGKEKGLPADEVVNFIDSYKKQK